MPSGAPEPAPSEPPREPAGDIATVVFHLTASQRRRYRVGLAGVAAIVWFLGLVRLVVTGRVTASSGWLGLVVLAAALGATAVAVGRVLPVVVLDARGIRARWGPRRSAVAWAAVSAVAVRERGTARRLVITHDGDHTVLPVPLTGGSILSAGVDPALDHKVDVVRQWWQGHRAP